MVKVREKALGFRPLAINYIIFSAKKCNLIISLNKNFRKFESFHLRYFGTFEPGVGK